MGNPTQPEFLLGWTHWVDPLHDLGLGGRVKSPLARWDPLAFDPSTVHNTAGNFQVATFL